MSERERERAVNIVSLREAQQTQFGNRSGLAQSRENDSTRRTCVVLSIARRGPKVIRARAPSGGQLVKLAENCK